MANLINTDEMSDTPIFAVLDGILLGKCITRVVDINKKKNLEIEFGQVFAFDEENKMWFGLYSHHFWNYDENDNLYDSYSQLNTAYRAYMGTGNLKGWKVVELDGKKFKWLKEEPTNATYQYQEIYKYLNKNYRNNKTADLIYVRDFGYAMPPDYKLIDWDVAELEIEKEEKEQESVETSIALLHELVTDEELEDDLSQISFTTAEQKLIELLKSRPNVSNK